MVRITVIIACGGNSYRLNYQLAKWSRFIWTLQNFIVDLVSVSSFFPCLRVSSSPSPSPSPSPSLPLPPFSSMSLFPASSPFPSLIPSPSPSLFLSPFLSLSPLFLCPYLFSHPRPCLHQCHTYVHTCIHANALDRGSGNLGDCELPNMSLHVDMGWASSGQFLGVKRQKTKVY